MHCRLYLLSLLISYNSEKTLLDVIMLPSYMTFCESTLTVLHIVLLVQLNETLVLLSVVFENLSASFDWLGNGRSEAFGA